MQTRRFDVVIVGAGPAGAAAAGALAGAGIPVALIETAVHAGAENWSGCVYFAESLAADDCFGRAAVEAAPYERRVIRRGTFAHNGLDLAGAELSDPAAFRDCYTVLRPVYDPYFAALARARGATLLTDTTVLSLLRKDGRVTGVQTDRGPLHAGVVFIAEGDASHLVAAERLERVAAPHFLQGIKAVLSLPAAEIDRRFGLGRLEGAAYEFLLRNPATGSRTAHLNAGAFLYTNRDSLSLGYVAPLENLRKHGRGDHGRLFEWLRGLPRVADLTAGATVTSYGAKLIRSGGWRERPALVADGLAVGGASAGLGIDLPFPNFTGPASATGLYFARAVKALLADGRPFDARSLDEAYLAPLLDSVYGRNARALSRWPGYFSSSSVLFGRTADVLCGAPRFLAGGSFADLARFLRPLLFTPQALAELAADKLRTVRALGLGRPLVAALLHHATAAAWLANLFRRGTVRDGRLSLSFSVEGSPVDALSLSGPAGRLLRRVQPALANAVAEIYANDGGPMDGKLRSALRTMVRSFSIADLVLLPLYGCALALTALGTAAADAFRYYVLKTPAAKMLAEPVMAYREALRKARDLDGVRSSPAIESKLALNTYRTGSSSHIRALWPAGAERHPDMSQSSLWWVCPARVYSYDAPLAGRGRVVVNWENCIKCESCWRAEPGGVLWGRFTDHRLVYRPRSGALPSLLASLRKHAAARPARSAMAEAAPLPGLPQRAAARSSAAAFREAVGHLPAAADAGRRAWPLALGERLGERLAALEAALRASGDTASADRVRSERDALTLHVREGRLCPALYAVSRMEPLLGQRGPAVPAAASLAGPPAGPDVESLAKLFPDRAVKQWEDAPMPEAWAVKLRALFRDQRSAGSGLVRSLAQISPALGLIAAHHAGGTALLEQAGLPASADVCALDGTGIAVEKEANGLSLTGKIALAPLAAASRIAVRAGDRAYVVPLAAPGVTVAPSPAVGLRAAGLATVTLDRVVPAAVIGPLPQGPAVRTTDHLAIALGAVEYLAKRAKEHALGRVQFGGQMLDTEGRDGIAKLGSVKALVARVEAWRLLLETLFEAVDGAARSEVGTPRSALAALCAAAAALAFGPEAGCPPYDAGQVFGGFAYSEDDLLSRSYRDSALFRFLAPGHGAAEQLAEALSGASLEKACAKELGGLDLAHGAPLDIPAGRWRAAAASWAGLPASADRALRGEAAALLVGVRGLLARTGMLLDAGGSPEPEAAAADVLLGLAEDAVMRAALSAGRGAVPPEASFPTAPDRPAVPLGIDYEAFCTRPGPPHRSGLFLRTVFDRSPRFVPEMQLHDARLRERWAELADWFIRNCRDAVPGGKPFERLVESLHGLPPPVLAGVRGRKWLATSVPPELDGLGWRKAEYYLLNAAAGSFGDASACLLIMASTSIGTTPVLLGLEEEIPRARRELAALADDPSRLGAIGGRLDRLVASFDHPDPGRIRRDFTALLALVDERLRHTSVAKYLSANFLRTFYGAGVAGRRGDAGAFMAGLRQAAVLYRAILPDVRAALDELPRRERSHRLFLRRLGHGGVSAFALTEPTAGSDSGGVRTTARLEQAPLTPLPDGRWSFLPAGGPPGERWLIDADRVVFTDAGMAYTAPDGEVCAISDGRFPRSFAWQGRDREFHDIGQVRRTPGGPVYEYYALTGAKMWITNASVATQFSLYAQAPEGVTGFMVDRSSEGLIVGADERKTGQRGSPTNEISLDSVRVPRENVIGFEGHGQVNALETLNVGRCGLAVVAGSLMRKLLDEARRDVPSSARRDGLLGEAAAVLFGSESLAYHLVGLFDRPHESVRMESAIAKYACSEDLHDFLTLVEQAYGPAGQTEAFLLEKARRDSRILNIYEGTNEVQRFLILKDLIAQAGDWPELPEQLEERPGDDAARTLARWKNTLRRHVAGAARRFGDAAWSDAMLQPALFPLAEMAGETLRLECLFYRREWLAERRGPLGDEYAGPMLAAAGRAVERTLARLQHLDAKFRSAWTIISAGLDMPEVIAADSAFDRMARASDATAGTAAPSAAARVLCILRPAADLPPSPLLHDGGLRELVWSIEPSDLAALAQALMMKGASPNTMTVDVLLSAGPEQESLLRQYAGPADRMVRLESGSVPAALAAAVRELEGAGAYDLIVAGASSRDGSPAPGPFLAGCLHRPWQTGERLAGGMRGIVGITALEREPRWDIGALVAAQEREIPVIVLPKSGGSEPWFEPAAAPPAAAAPLVTTVPGAAGLLRSHAAAVTASRAPGFTGPLAAGGLPRGPAAWALLDGADSAAASAVLRACRMAADRAGTKASALVAAPEAALPGLLGLARAKGIDAAFCFSTGGAALSGAGRRGLLRNLLGVTGDNSLFAGSGWDDAFGRAAGEMAAAGREAVVVSGAAGLRFLPDGAMEVLSPAYAGKLTRVVRLGGGAAFITVAPEMELPLPRAAADFRAVMLGLDPGPDWLEPQPPPATPTLGRAEVIIDVGYGVRDASGMALVQELKAKLEALGLEPMLGATRKVTQDLKLLPLEAQIGQTGVRVNPKLVIALGISGAPQHIDYLGTRADILCFNKDPEAPLMQLNRTRPAPRVHPIPGDLFVTVRELIRKLN